MPGLIYGIFLSEYNIRKKTPRFFAFKGKVFLICFRKLVGMWGQIDCRDRHRNNFYLMQFHSLVRSQTLSCKSIRNINELLQLSTEKSKGFVFRPETSLRAADESMACCRVFLSGLTPCPVRRGRQTNAMALCGTCSACFHTIATE